jgi:hypothetical protein
VENARERLLDCIGFFLTLQEERTTKREKKERKEMKANREKGTKPPKERRETDLVREFEKTRKNLNSESALLQGVQRRKNFQSLREGRERRERGG